MLGAGPVAVALGPIMGKVAAAFFAAGCVRAWVRASPSCDNWWRLLLEFCVAPACNRQKTGSHAHAPGTGPGVYLATMRNGNMYLT